MSLQYPLFFPHGEDGYHPGLLLAGGGIEASVQMSTGDRSETDGQRRKRRTQMSATQYYCFRLQQRRQEPKRIHQFIVDAYTSIELSRLTYHRTHQFLL